MTRTETGLPFDDIRNVVRGLPGPDLEARAAVTAREPLLTKPAGALGRLEDITAWLASWQGQPQPKVLAPNVVIFAGTHGVTAHGVSPYPSEVTQQMVINFAAGGAAINQLCAAADAGLQVFDLALDVPTGDITVEAAMSEKDCAATIAYGMEAVAKGGDLLCIGEMGIGNTTIAATICCALLGGTAADWAGRGAGSDDAGVARKAAAVEAALETHAARLNDPLEVLRCLGGREFAAIVGAIIAARYQRLPVLLDGFVVTAAAAVLWKMRPDALDHCLAAHRSAEAAHGRLLDTLGLDPLLDLGMRLGEGSGAALAIPLVRAAAACHAGMATFAQADVSGPVT